MLRTGSKYTEEEDGEGKLAPVTSLEAGVDVAVSPKKKLSESLVSVCF